MSNNTILPENAVAERYAAAAEEREEALCCPVSYNADLLKNIPQEIIDKDYGCGDPSAYVREGDVVVDLGSGGGKLCYMTSQLVGETGHVIGVDVNQTMLSLARKYKDEMAQKLGYGNVEFRYGRIQDLALDLNQFDSEVSKLPADEPGRAFEIVNLMQRLRAESPMIADNSVDCVISNCVLNLVNPEDRKQLFREIHRVLKVGGRAAISDIVCDEDVPLEMQQDGHLWSGCLSGAWREDRFVEEFADAGFHGVEISKYQSEPWQVINGLEFRSVTILAVKADPGVCLERNQAVIYRGPFEQIKDDDGLIYRRGQRTAVCDKTFQRLTQPPYADMFIPVEPKTAIPLDKAVECECKPTRVRSARETKGQEYDLTVIGDPNACDPGSGCC